MTLGWLLRRAARSRPERTAVVDGRTRLTYEALDDLVDRVAYGLRAQGVRAGDTVSCILPNRAETVVLFFAAARSGAVFSPIVPIYGAREVRFILRQTGSVLVVVPARFRGVDYRPLIERVGPQVPSLRSMIVVADGFPSTVLRSAQPFEGPDDSGAIATVLYTSGRTAGPNGRCTAMTRSSRRPARRSPLTGSPTSSATAAPTRPARRRSCTASSSGRASRTGACGRADLPLRRRRRAPPVLIRRAIERLGVRTGRGYGSAESPSVTSSSGPDVPLAKHAETNGAPIGPNDVELGDEDGLPVPAGPPGEIWARGPALFRGDRDAALDAEAFNARPFFRTGDLGVLDVDDYLTVTGRVKDIIVRGGEKLSAKDIEDLVFEHPKVRGVVVIPAPDPRLGERVCAVVVPAGRGAPPTLDELVVFLATPEISRRKLPERIEIVDELRVTASGKVQKHVQRDALARRLGSECSA